MLLYIKLTSINISWCDLITVNGVRVLTEGCANLKIFIAKVIFLLNNNNNNNINA